MAREPDLFSLSWVGFYARRAARIQPMLAVSILLGIAALLLADRTLAQSGIFLGTGLPFDASFWISLATFSFN